jgi:acetyltransferase-like isoleucine patch superfamily enzyme
MSQKGYTKIERLNILAQMERHKEIIRKDKGYIYPSVVILSAEFKLGTGSHIGMYSIIAGPVTIGNWCLISPHVYMWANEHGLDPSSEICTQPIIAMPIVIGDDVWIGTGSIITGGVTICNHAVVGAGSVVTHDIPEYEIWAGVPARKIGDRRMWKK